MPPLPKAVRSETSPWQSWFIYYCFRLIAATRGWSAEGLEHIPRKGPVILAVNHVSMMDPVLVGVAVFPLRALHALAKEEMFRVPILGRIFRAAGIIPLSRRGGDLGAMRSAVKALENDGCLVVFPEGTRSRTGKPGRAKGGLGLLARASSALVVPARVFNTDRWFGRIKIRFGPPLRFDGGDGRGGALEFSKRVLDTILKL